MAVIRISDENKQKLDDLLAKKIGETKNLDLTVNDIITGLLFVNEVKT
jgi:predicted DNA-binding protein